MARPLLLVIAVLLAGGCARLLEGGTASSATDRGGPIDRGELVGERGRGDAPVRDGARGERRAFDLLPSGEMACAPPLSLCAGECVNLQADLLNCGGCSKSCGSGSGCFGGVCTCMNGVTCTAGSCCGTVCCAGCCSLSGECELGNSNLACGRGGQACVDCRVDPCIGRCEPATRACVYDMPLLDGTTCWSTSAPGVCRAGKCCIGCWDGSLATCVAPAMQTNAKCGIAGALCAICTAAQKCLQGICQ